MRRLVIVGGLVLLAACAGPRPLTGTDRIDNVPMYGQPQIPRPETHRKADEEFISQAAAKFGGREQASKVWAAQAERFMAQGNHDFAMRRYNQSWLLNPNHYAPYWGFGRVMLERDNKVDEAIGHLEKAMQLIDDPFQKVALLTDAATAYSVKANQTPAAPAPYFERANRLFEESVAMDPKYPNSWRSWARSLYFEGRYREAWEKVDKARSLGAPPFPASFLKALSDKMPEPR